MAIVASIRSIFDARGTRERARSYAIVASESKREAVELQLLNAS